MNKLIVNGYVIQEPIINIIRQLKTELKNNKLADIVDKHNNVVVSCPVHKNGLEKHASCYVYAGDDPTVEYGSFHCFTCGEAGPLYHFIADCFDATDDFGKQWLIERYGDTIASYNLFDSDIDLSVKPTTSISESILSGMESYHPYLQQRGISKDTCIKLGVKYDPKTKSVVFPIRDISGNIKFLTRRSVEMKKFYIDGDADKSNIYLLNEVLSQGYSSVVICESQFNALTCWENGIPGVALLGSGTPDKQMETLNKTSIRHYVLAYDNDQAGLKGAERFKKNIRQDVFVDEVLMPEGRDINDLTKEEFDNLIGSFFKANV